jgi:hypothetical protein
VYAGILLEIIFSTGVLGSSGSNAGISSVIISPQRLQVFCCSPGTPISGCLVITQSP